MQLKELASLLVGAVTEGDPATEITGLATDSRRVEPGDLFICLPGSAYDGHQFAGQALERGAAALVVDRKLDGIQAPMIRVKDTRLAMAVMASHFYGYPSRELKVIGITGTNGKTTVSYLIEKILADQGRSTGLMGTIRMKIGGRAYDVKNTTQEALELQRHFRAMREAGAEYCIMEVSSHALEQGRVKGTRFRTAVFTNLTQDHLDYHRTMERYKQAKGLLFSRLGNTYAASPDERQYAVLNADDEASADYAAMTAAQVVTYGIERPADVRAEAVTVHAGGARFRVSTFAGSCEVRLRLAGKFNVYNALAAIAVGLLEGIPLPRIRDSLEAVEGVEGRFELIREGQDFHVIVDYAHTPDSLENVLATISEIAEARIICVFGCGGDRDRTKRPLMGEIAARYSDYCIVTSDNPRSEDPEQILRDIEDGMLRAGVERSQYEKIVDRRQAIEKAVAMAGPRDVVLIAGKGHETYQETKGVRVHFDDREVARQAIRSRS